MVAFYEHEGQLGFNDDEQALGMPEFAAASTFEHFRDMIAGEIRRNDGLIDFYMGRQAAGELRTDEMTELTQVGRRTSALVTLALNMDVIAPEVTAYNQFEAMKMLFYGPAFGETEQS